MRAGVSLLFAMMLLGIAVLPFIYEKVIGTPDLVEVCLIVAIQLTLIVAAIKLMYEIKAVTSNEWMEKEDD